MFTHGFRRTRISRFSYRFIIFLSPKGRRGGMIDLES